MRQLPENLVLILSGTSA